MAITKSIPNPGPWNLVELQEQAMDNLLDLLGVEKDPKQVHSIVEIIAESSGVPLMAYPDDPMELADFLGGRWVTAIDMAGTDHESRLRLVRMAVGKIRELLAVIEEWEVEAGTSELESRWTEFARPYDSSSRPGGHGEA